MKIGVSNVLASGVPFYQMQWQREIETWAKYSPPSTAKLQSCFASHDEMLPKETILKYVPFFVNEEYHIMIATKGSKFDEHFLQRLINEINLVSYTWLILSINYLIKTT